MDFKNEYNKKAFKGLKSKKDFLSYQEKELGKYSKYQRKYAFLVRITCLLQKQANGSFCKEGKR